MTQLVQGIRSADGKYEKHAPIIECPDKVQANELFPVSISVGRSTAHPNTPEHHIRWIALHFHAEGEKTPCQVGYFEFAANGGSGSGVDQAGVSSHHGTTSWIKVSKAGVLQAMAYCNVHGLWETSKDIKVFDAA